MNLKLSNRDIQVAIRAARKSRGLTCAGKPRRNKIHAELHGLDEKTYHRLYMRKQRSPAGAPIK